jgi:hypothetical protein
MNEAKALRALADKLDELEGLKQFPADITEPGDLQVTWSEGRDHDGYSTLSAAISALVSQHWNALRSQVLKSKEGEVQAARAVWTGVSTNTGDAAQTAENGFRKAG